MQLCNFSLEVANGDECDIEGHFLVAVWQQTAKKCADCGFWIGTEVVAWIVDEERSVRRKRRQCDQATDLNSFILGIQNLDQVLPF